MSKKIGFWKWFMGDSNRKALVMLIIYVSIFLTTSGTITAIISIENGYDIFQSLLIMIIVSLGVLGLFLIGVLILGLYVVCQDLWKSYKKEVK